MADNPLISVIIPVYNSEMFLDECLESLIYQTYSNLEFICINDGSTDSSYEILKQYREKDTRFVILNQTNQGAGRARNAGINIARGKYLSFIDSDDRVSLSLYQKFINLNEKPDIYVFNASEYNKQTRDVYPRYFFSINEWQRHKDDNTIHTFNDNVNPFHGNISAVNKIYRTEFLKSLIKKTPDGKLFPVDTIFEDQYFFFLTMIFAKSIMVNPDPLYYYRSTNNNSVTQNLSSKVFDIFGIIDKIEYLLKITNNYEAYKYALFQHKYKQYAHLFFKADEDLRADFYKEMKARLMRYRDENLNPKICERLTFYGVYKNILKLDAREFYEKYNGKIKDAK